MDAIMAWGGWIYVGWGIVIVAAGFVFWKLTHRKSKKYGGGGRTTPTGGNGNPDVPEQPTLDRSGRIIR